jgi:hypothetical protein
MVLQIVPEPLKPDCETGYSEIEEDTARNSVIEWIDTDSEFWNQK